MNNAPGMGLWTLGSMATMEDGQNYGNNKKLIGSLYSFFLSKVKK